MGLSKLSLKHIQNRWGRRNEFPEVSDWADLLISRVNVVTGDNVIVNLHAQEELVAGTISNLNLTGATALHCIIRASIDPDSVLYGLQTAYNQGDYAAGEILTEGKVTWNLSIGYVAYAVTAVDTGTKRFSISGDWTAQFASGNTIKIDGSTGNDGTYTIDGTPTYDSTDDETDIIVTTTPPSAVADGDVNHTALQNATYTSGGYLDAFLECSWISDTGNPQTLLPATRCRIHDELDTGQTGISAGSSITYLTAAEVAATYVKKVNYNKRTTITGVTTLPTDIPGTKVWLCNGTFTVTLPDPTSCDEEFQPIIMNIGTGTITIAPATGDTINGDSSDLTLVGKYSAVHLLHDDTNWMAPDWIIP